ncbi:NADH-quinone oxidoreductase subunit B family protein [Desulfoscipio sp. XC116]|uniref:NADH-quinone oxidoreductase subunit B family protein n=1 Tax=Desulfoscipio sp. XC116 TaxID=3144975 RepID=UPI00325BD122
MPEKVKLAYLLAGGCAGCDMAVVDLSETLLDVLPQLEIVFWAPTVADVKYKDLEAMPDGSIDVGLVAGMVRLSEQEHMVKVMRRKCKTLIALGICASMGGIPGMANMHSKKEIFDTAYFDTFSTDNPEGVVPRTNCLVDGKYELTLPDFYEKVRSVASVVDVDYLTGGCPPHHSFIGAALTAVLEGKLPPRGSWLTGGKAVCDVCKRNPALQGKERELIQDIKRVTDGEPEQDKCLLQEGYICLGPVTQGDCNAQCPNVNMPCRGCGGPIPGVKDFGLRAVSAIAASMTDEKLVDKIDCPAKLFYRYSLPSSILGGKLK